MRSILILLLMCMVIPAQAARIALVIGNNAYQGSYHLGKKPINDAADMRVLLKQVGFKVYHYTDLTRKKLKNTIRQFSRKVKKGDQVVVYYSGHGMQYHQSNYLIPIRSIKEVDIPAHLDDEAIKVDYLLKTVAYNNPAINIVILDACRTSPFKGLFKGDDAVDGLSAQKAPSGTLLAYATEENKAALAGRGRNSPYVVALKEELPRAGQSIFEMFTNVRKKVSARTGGEQEPNFSSKLDGSFCFVSCDQPSQMFTLNVSSNVKGAMVWLNGEAKGRAPRALQVETGRHQVQVIQQGYETFEQWLDVQRDQRLMARLEKKIVIPDEAEKDTQIVQRDKQFEIDY